MTAGVSRTIETELHNIARCHSACVYALIGAKVRQVPPGARIGVHNGKSNGFDFEGRYRAISNELVRRYLRDMGIADGSLEVISRVPHESAYHLSRDEIADFGIDTREFQETRWIAMEWPWAGMELPSQPLSVLKLVVEAKGEGRKQYQTTVIRLSCARPGRVGLGYLRRLASNEIGAARSIELLVDGGKLSFPHEASISKIDAIETGGSFETRYTSAALAFFEAAATRDRIDIVESDRMGSTTSSRIVKLSTDGLSKALERLKKACGERQDFPTFPASRLTVRRACHVIVFIRRIRRIRPAGGSYHGSATRSPMKLRDRELSAALAYSSLLFSRDVLMPAWMSSALARHQGRGGRVAARACVAADRVLRGERRPERLRGGLWRMDRRGGYDR